MGWELWDSLGSDYLPERKEVIFKAMQMHARWTSVVLVSSIQSAQKVISSHVGKDGKEEEDVEV